MDRDLRLTGNRRGQTNEPIAPLGFELNQPWKVRSLRWCPSMAIDRKILTLCAIARDKDYVDTTSSHDQRREAGRRKERSMRRRGVIGITGGLEDNRETFGAFLQQIDFPSTVGCPTASSEAML